MIEDALNELGYTSFDRAVSGQEALTLAQRRPPDLITSDVLLGTENGIETVQTICSDKPVPVVFVTAISWEVRARTPNHPVVQKPFQPEALKEAVGRSIAAAGKPT